MVFFLVNRLMTFACNIRLAASPFPATHLIQVYKPTVGIIGMYRACKLLQYYYCTCCALVCFSFINGFRKILSKEYSEILATSLKMLKIYIFSDKKNIRAINETRIKLLISNFRRVLNVVCFLLGDSPASEFYMPTFRNTLSVPSSQAGRCL